MLIIKQVVEANFLVSTLSKKLSSQDNVNALEISENLKAHLIRYEKELVERKDTSRYSYYECKENRRIYNEQNLITRIILETE